MSLIAATPFFDAGIPFLVVPLGLGFALIVALLIAGLETAILVALGWASWRTSARDAAIANLLSAVVGILIYVPLLMGSSLGPPLFVPMLLFVLTLVAEGAYLLRLHRHPTGRTLRAVLAMNMASYALMFLLLFLLF